MSNVSENIKIFRTKCNLKQSELAKMLGKGSSVIANWEAGTNRPDVDSIQKMCEIFKIDANTLFGWADSNSKISTIDALLDLQDFTKEELEEMRQFAEFIKLKRGSSK